jgi:Tfp pilus assembly protein PilE
MDGLWAVWALLCLLLLFLLIWTAYRSYVRKSLRAQARRRAALNTLLAEADALQQQSRTEDPAPDEQ